MPPFMVMEQTPGSSSFPSPACRHFVHDHLFGAVAGKEELHPLEIMAAVTQHVYQPGVLICCWGGERNIPHRAALVAGMGELGLMGTWGWIGG